MSPDPPSFTDDRVVRIGDRIRFSFQLMRAIIEQHDGLSEVVVVQRIDTEPSGEKVLWMQKAQALHGDR